MCSDLENDNKQPCGAHEKKIVGWMRNYDNNLCSCHYFGGNKVKLSLGMMPVVTLTLIKSVYFLPFYFPPFILLFFTELPSSVQKNEQP